MHGDGASSLLDMIPSAGNRLFLDRIALVVEQVLGWCGSPTRCQILLSTEYS
jgi:hypothetical protein